MKKARVLGGVTEIDGVWRPFFEIHKPCFGGTHEGCVVTLHRVGPKCRDRVHALEELMETRGGITSKPPAGEAS